MTRGKNFSLTKNNPDEALEEFHSVLKRDAVYARAQLERGEEGTPHFQACVGYSKTTRLNAVIKRFPGCHVELSKNAMAAYAYCGKSDTRLEGPLDHGVPPASLRVKGDKKERNKLILQYGVVKAVDEGLIDIEKVKQLKQSIDLYNLMGAKPQPQSELLHEWHWGATGTGKTRGVRERFPDAYLKSNTKWWDGYNGEEVAILDEMTPGTIGSQHIKLWSDHYPFSAETKGGSVKIRPKVIIITSNYSIRECYSDSRDYEAIERRFKIHHYPQLM